VVCGKDQMALMVGNVINFVVPEFRPQGPREPGAPASQVLAEVLRLHISYSNAGDKPCKLVALIVTQ
jgi:hypothetical protein